MKLKTLLNSLTSNLDKVFFGLIVEYQSLLVMDENTKKYIKQAAKVKRIYKELIPFRGLLGNRYPMLKGVLAEIEDAFFYSENDSDKIITNNVSEEIITH